MEIKNHDFRKEVSHFHAAIKRTFRTLPTLLFLNPSSYPYGMPNPDRYGIIANFDILSEDYIPENIPGRESQIKELKLCLDPDEPTNWGRTRLTA